jgi:hypothetical protein
MINHLNNLKEKFKGIISKYVPPPSLDYCIALWDKYRFGFKVTRNRRSKLGDYRFHRIKKQHIVTVNGSMNPYGFLITYIHEIAHLAHYELKGNNSPPHGKIWKNLFIELMEPVMIPEIFPEDLLYRLKKHMKNPKASSYSDIHLARAIKKYDNDKTEEGIPLEDIKIGEFFMLHNKTFEKVEKKRTRSLCLDIRSGKRYLISEIAIVKKTK